MDEENQKRNFITVASLFIGDGTRGFVYKHDVNYSTNITLFNKTYSRDLNWYTRHLTQT
jgi:hypothetical protein